MSSIVSERGQITVDRSVRRALGVEPGMVAVQVVVGNHLEVHFLPPAHEDSLLGILKVTPGRNYEDWESIRKEAAQGIAEDAMRPA
jgi:bifunctional DNA-binding transcriptional regulator/antitoxin component of YhaV-PrlF toxin-antitoxin module